MAEGGVTCLKSLCVVLVLLVQLPLSSPAASRQSPLLASNTAGFEPPPAMTPLFEGIGRPSPALSLSFEEQHTLQRLRDGHAVVIQRKTVHSAVALAALSLLGFAVLMVFLLRWRIRERTRELQRTLAELHLKNRALEAEMGERLQVEKDKERLIHELREALENVRRLRGLLPICAYCKKIRDDKGYWNQLEAYLSEHSEVSFTHGICPDCAKRIQEELRLFKEGESVADKATTA